MARFLKRAMAVAIAASVASISPASANTNSIPQDLPTVTVDVREAIKDVQSKANLSIKYKDDDEDIWQVAGRRGDCEDIVLWKRQQLIQLGLNASDLEVLVLIKPKSKKGGGVREGHVVLRVKSANTVLDNFERFPMDYAEYMKKHDYRLICEAVDFRPSMRVQDRCRPKGA